MKKILLATLSAIMCITPLAYAEPFSDSNAYYNSWIHAWPQMVSINENIYLISRGHGLQKDVMTVWTVSENKKEQLFRRPNILYIERLNDRLMIFREHCNLAEWLTNSAGTMIIDFYSISGRRTPDRFRSYHRGKERSHYFTYNNTIFLKRREGEVNSLFRIDDGKEVLLASNTGKMERHCPTFVTLSIDEWHAHMSSWKTILKLFDLVTGEIYLTEKEIHLNPNTTFPQAVLLDEKLYYLSPEGLNVWSFATSEDQALLHIEKHGYDCFTLFENTAMLFHGNDKGHFADWYDLSTGTLIRKFSFRTFYNDVCIINSQLYVYNDNVLEIIDLNTGANKQIGF